MQYMRPIWGNVSAIDDFSSPSLIVISNYKAMIFLQENEHENVICQASVVKIWPKHVEMAT